MKIELDNDEGIKGKATKRMGLAGTMGAAEQGREPSLAMACYQKRGLLKAKRSLLFCNCPRLP